MLPTARLCAFLLPRSCPQPALPGSPGHLHPSPSTLVPIPHALCVSAPHPSCPAPCPCASHPSAWSPTPVYCNSAACPSALYPNPQYASPPTPVHCPPPVKGGLRKRKRQGHRAGGPPQSNPKCACLGPGSPHPPHQQEIQGPGMGVGCLLLSLWVLAASWVVEVPHRALLAGGGVWSAVSGRCCPVESSGCS